MNLQELKQQHIPVRQIAEQVLLEAEDEHLSVPGHDMSDPANSKFLRELKHLKRTDIKLYRKIISGH